MSQLLRARFATPIRELIALGYADSTAAVKVTISILHYCGGGINTDYPTSEETRGNGGWSFYRDAHLNCGNNQ